MHVLVVEDESGIADFLERGLRAESYDVTVARDGIAGPPGRPRRPAGAALAPRDRRAGLLPAPARPGALAGAHPQRGVGDRRRLAEQPGGRLRRVPAAQAGPARAARADPDAPGRRLPAGDRRLS